MKILLLGATGRTGKLALSYALGKGYQVNCLARNSGRIESKDNLNIFEGNPNNRVQLEEAITDCEAVISILNISRTSDFPWSSLRTPKTFLSDVMKLLVPLARKHNIKRVSVCSAWGVADTRPDIPFWFRWLIDYSNIGVAYKDHERQEEVLTNSNLDWRIVRPVGLIDLNREEHIKETYNNRPKPSLLINRQSVAKYLVDSLYRKDLIKEKVVISRQ